MGIVEKSRTVVGMDQDVKSSRILFHHLALQWQYRRSGLHLQFSSVMVTENLAQSCADARGKTLNILINKCNKEGGGMFK